MILEVDHIKPIAEGGTDEFVNLVTSCRDCNRGKGKTLLSKNDEVKKQQSKLIELAEKTEQSEMMLDWRMELELALNTQVEKLCDIITQKTGFPISIEDEVLVKKLLNQFSVKEVIQGIEAAYTRYFDGSINSFDVFLNKIGGICFNKRRDKENGNIQKYTD